MRRETSLRAVLRYLLYGIAGAFLGMVSGYLALLSITLSARSLGMTGSGNFFYEFLIPTFVSLFGGAGLFAYFGYLLARRKHVQAVERDAREGFATN